LLPVLRWCSDSKHTRLRPLNFLTPLPLSFQGCCSMRIGQGATNLPSKRARFVKQNPFSWPRSFLDFPYKLSPSARFRLLCRCDDHFAASTLFVRGLRARSLFPASVCFWVPLLARSGGFSLAHWRDPRFFTRASFSTAVWIPVKIPLVCYRPRPPTARWQFL